MKIKTRLQTILDKHDYFCHKECIVIGNEEYQWCSIPVPSGYPKQSQTHPAIVFAPQKWNGYSYWIATTPYPDGDVRYENPCIYRSNDSIHFLPIIKNPILDYPGNNAYNSDPELFFHENKLYCIVRENENGNFLREIKLLFSSNGNDWSIPKTIYTSNDETRQLLSPSYLNRNGQHLIYFLNGDAGVGRSGKCTGIEIIKSENSEMSDFKAFALGDFLNKDEAEIEPWHFDLFEYHDRLYMVLCGRDKSKTTWRNPMYTYLAVSEDYVNFRIYRKPVVRYLKSYRPSAYMDNKGILHLYFSVIGRFLKDNSDRNIAKTSLSLKDLLINLQ
jgi:hypothetical protein